MIILEGLFHTLTKLFLYNKHVYGIYRKVLLCVHCVKYYNVYTP